MTDATRIAVVRMLPGVGDLLCAVPALRAVRRAEPTAEVTFIGLPGSHWFAARFSAYIDRWAPCSSCPGLPESRSDTARVRAVHGRRTRRRLRHRRPDARRRPGHERFHRRPRCGALGWPVHRRDGAARRRAGPAAARSPRGGPVPRRRRLPRDRRRRPRAGVPGGRGRTTPRPHGSSPPPVRSRWSTRGRAAPNAVGRRRISRPWWITSAAPSTGSS